MKIDTRIFRDLSSAPNWALARWAVRVPSSMLTVGIILTGLLGGAVWMSTQDKLLGWVAWGTAACLCPLFILGFIGTTRTMKIVARRLDPHFEEENPSEQNAGQVSPEAAPSAASDEPSA